MAYPIQSQVFCILWTSKSFKVYIVGGVAVMLRSLESFQTSFTKSIVDLLHKLT